MKAFFLMIALADFALAALVPRQPLYPNPPLWESQHDPDDDCSKELDTGFILCDPQDKSKPVYTLAPIETP